MPTTFTLFLFRAFGTINLSTLSLPLTLRKITRLSPPAQLQCLYFGVRKTADKATCVISGIFILPDRSCITRKFCHLCIISVTGDASHVWTQCAANALNLSHILSCPISFMPKCNSLAVASLPLGHKDTWTYTYIQPSML